MTGQYGKRNRTRYRYAARYGTRSRDLLPRLPHSRPVLRRPLGYRRYEHGRRLFAEQLGVSLLAVEQTRCAHFAKRFVMRANAEFVLLGIPSSAGAWCGGQEKAPLRLREQGICDRLRSRGFHVRDIGDAPTATYADDPENPKQKNVRLVRSVALDAAKRLDEVMDGNVVPLVLGGGCTVTIGVLAAMTSRYDRLGLVYVDGDLDFNTPATSPSGTLDGMGLAHIVGMGAQELTHVTSTVPLVPEERVTVFGYNPEAGWIDACEIEWLNDSAIIRFSASEVRRDPVAAARAAIGRMQHVADHYLLHFDVDVMDVAEFPASDAQHEFGLSAADAATALGEFARNPRCVGMVVTEYNPDLDPTGACARKLIDLIETVLAGLPAK